jgi:hypothetical protein
VPLVWKVSPINLFVKALHKAINKANDKEAAVQGFTSGTAAQCHIRRTCPMEVKGPDEDAQHA